MSKRILVVDDEKDVSYVMEKKLTRVGYSVALANDGQTALNMAKRGGIDLIITDIIMPVMDGYTFYKELKNCAATKDIPVIVVTGRVGMEDSLNAVGVDRVLKKPFDIDDDLVDMVSDLIRLSKKSKKQKKALVYSKYSKISQEMSLLLEQRGVKVSKAFDGADFLAKSLTFVPNLVLLDILIEDISCPELIRAMKCFFRLRDVDIVLFTFFTEDMLGDVDTIEQLKESKDRCLESGATKYIGRFSRANFIGNVEPFL
ncbi:MAG: response regulator [Candidatus Omnitrophica bacterium]|nr:response regulator [Candidatus Omnitrophota bacterium]